MLVPLEDGEHEVGLVRAHLEEDAAKTVHVGGASGRIGGASHSLVDFNRGGTPLVEIVTQPDIHSAEEAKRFLQLLRQTIVELGVSDAEMEKGTLRVDANVSVRPRGSDELRTRCEIKNMNSFNFIARGIELEVERQIRIWETGGEVVQQTFDFEPAGGTLSPRRVKEEADDYRYFPEPDLVPLEPSRDLVERLRGELPELPADRIRRFERDYGLPFYDFTDLVSGGTLAPGATSPFPEITFSYRSGGSTRTTVNNPITSMCHIGRMPRVRGFFSTFAISAGGIIAIMPVSCGNPGTL